jgi:outer membrane protein assembly factor BamA
MRQTFIQRNVTVKAGVFLSEGEMLESESKLYDLGDFDWAEVSPRKPITDQTQEEVLVKVHEAGRNSLAFGFGFESTSRSGSLSSGVIALPGLPTVGLPSNFTVIEKNIFSPVGSIEYSRLDLWGLGETGSVSMLLSILDPKASLSYSIPQFLGLNSNALWSLSAERNSMNPLFTAQSAIGSFHIEKVLDSARTERLQFKYAFQRTSLSNLLIQNFVPAQDQSIRSSFLSASFTRDTRDNPLDAHKGVFQTVDFRVNPKIIGSSDNFERVFGQTSYYWQVAPWMIWANNVRLGLMNTFGGSHVPFSEQFFSGGADSLRGFPLNGAGPQGTAVLCTKSNDPSTCTEKITVPAGGNQLFIFNSESRFPIPPPASFLKGLGGVFFYDGGNVYRRIGFGQFLAGYSNTVGFGLRYKTPVGPLRIDLGRNLNPVPGLKSLQLFVTLGQSF